MSVDRLSERSRTYLRGAEAYAADLHQSRVLPAHLLVAMLADGDGDVARIVREVTGDTTRLEKRVHDAVRRLARRGGDAQHDPALQAVLDAAARQAKRDGDGAVEPAHLLVAIADGPPGPARDALETSGVTRDSIRFAMRGADDNARLRRIGGDAPSSGSAPPPASPSTSRKRKKRSSDDEEGAMLDRFGRDLTELARSGELDPIVGRDDEIRRIMQILGRRSKNNPVLIGEAGVGKTAIIEGFAHRLAGDDLPFNLRDKRLVELDLGALVAGTTLRGQFEARVKKLVDEIAAAQGSIIVYIDEIHSLVGAGGSGDSGGAADMLKPALARGEVTVIGTTTPAEYRRHIENDKALERRFQEIFVDEPDVEASIAILRGIKERYEIHHRVRITDAAVQAAVRLAERYVTDRKLPDKAVDLVDEAASRLRMEVDSQPEEMYELERRISHIEGQRAALLQEADAGSSKAVQTMDGELADLRSQLEALAARLAAEKRALDAVTEVKAQLEATRRAVEQARADGDEARVAELEYSVIPRLDAELASRTETLDQMHGEGRMLREEVTEEDIAEVVGDWTGVPTTKMLEGERQKILAVGERLSQRVIGQQQAVEAIAGAVRRSRAGVQDRNRPIGSFFFVGPTGVGKTELAKALAEFLFDSEDALIRIDMSEYMEQSKVNTLIGAAYGYVDSDKGGLLTEAVRRRPYSVVLFDEAEKAHPDVFNILLQVLDEGRLSDSQGRRVDFTNTIVIMTSNVGARRILDLSGQVEYEELQGTVMDILKDHFKPEFLNRIDEKVVFAALDRDSIRTIFDLLLHSFNRLIAEQELSIRFTDGARDHVIDVGYQPEYGARPLKRAMLTEVQDPLALDILEGKFQPGDTIVADLHEEGGRLVFRRDEVAAE